MQTGGPVAETREPLRALFVFECDDAAVALEVAARIPAARNGGAVEVWPLTER